MFTLSSLRVCQKHFCKKDERLALSTPQRLRTIQPGAKAAPGRPIHHRLRSRVSSAAVFHLGRRDEPSEGDPLVFFVGKSEPLFFLCAGVPGRAGPMSNVTKDEQEVDSAEFARILTKQVNLGVVGLHVARTAESSLIVGKSLFGGFWEAKGKKSEAGRVGQ